MDTLRYDLYSVVSCRNISNADSDGSAQIIVLHEFDFSLIVIDPDLHAFLDDLGIIAGQNDLGNSLIDRSCSVDRRLQILNICPDDDTNQ